MKFTVFQKVKDDSKAYEVALKETANKYGLEYSPEDPDVVIFIGGDGTFLKAIQHYADKLDKLKFFGLNIGNLGFFYDYDFADIDVAIKNLASGNYKEESYHLLESTIHCGDNTNKVIYALNEVRIENPFHTLICDVYINNKKLETFRGTGLLVSTAIGSSAYNKSLGGAIIDPSLDLLEFTEIATIQNNAYHPLGSSVVVNGKHKIVFKGDFSNSVVGFDSLVCDITPNGEISFTSSNKVAHVIYKKSHTYIDKLNKSFIR